MSRYKDSGQRGMWLLVASIVSVIVALVFASKQSWFLALFSIVIGVVFFLCMLFSGGNDNAPQ